MRDEFNAFLALLEGRPETFREVLRGLPRPSSPPLSSIQERIHMASENIKCRAVKEAVREIFNRSLRLEPDEKVWNNADTRDAFYSGVEAVEELLAKVLETCEETEKQLGPSHQALP